MKKRVLYFVIVLALALCMTLPMTTPVMAGQIGGTKNTIPSSPNIYRIGDTIYYVTTVSNPAGNTKNNTLTRIWDTLPDGTVIEFLGASETLVQAPGDTDYFYIEYVVDWDDAEYNAILGYWVVKDTFEAEGYDSGGDGIYVRVTKNSRIIRPDIDIEKYTNGQDADAPTGPLIAVGANVAWTYNVTNTGDADLDPVVVVDDNGTPGNTGDDFSPTYVGGDDGDGILNPSEVWYYSYNGTAAAGQYANNATATGTPPVGDPVSDSDPSHYFGGNPGIDLIKYVSVNNQTSWDDANSPPGPGILVGKNVYFKFRIQNTGNVTLTGITLIDTVYNLAGITPALPASLAADAVYEGIIGPIAATAGSHTNTGNATGYWEGNPVSDTDPANYLGLSPGIDLIKYVSVNNQTSWDDANSPPGPGILVGKNVYFKFRIQNTGNETLTGITLIDTVYNLTGITPALPASLAADAVYEGIIGPIAATAGSHTNTGNATGYWEGNPVSDTDPANYFGGGPGIDLVKYVSVNNQVSWDDANSPPGPSILVGNGVYFKFRVQNTGNVTLTGITLIDTLYNLTGITPALPASLVAGAVYEGIIGPIAATAGSHTNTGNTTGYWEGNPVSDTDPANYFGSPPPPAIDIEKHTNGEDADYPPGPYISINSSVTWTYIVTNTGGVNLTGIVITDDKLGLIGTIPSLSVNATQTLFAYGTAAAGQYANNATVVGYYDAGNVTDWDPSHYYSRPTVVGWETYPINKVRVLLPWIGLLAAIIAGTSLLVLRRRRLTWKSQS